jgi:hypothetical protein
MYSLYFFFFLKINPHSSVTGTVGCSKDDGDEGYAVDVDTFRFGSVL